MSYTEDQYPEPELEDELSDEEIFNDELLEADEKNQALLDETSWDKFIGHEH